MRFSSKRAVCYLVNQFYHCLLIGCDDEKRQELDKYEGEDEGENERYVFFPFIAPLLLSQKESNRLTDLGENTKSLNHLVCILKICYSEKC